MDEDVVKNQDLLGGEDFSNLQSCIDILELKVEMIDQCRAKVLKQHPPLSSLFEQYEQYITKLLSKYGINLM